MDKAALALLEAELNDRYQAVANVYERVRQRQASFPKTPEAVESMALQLHHLYGAYEQLFETVAGFFENRIEGHRYHADLLRRMKIDIARIRPALLSEQTYLWLDELRRFRHFLRHCYTADLAVQQVSGVLSVALQLEQVVRQDMDGFLAKLGPDVMERGNAEGGSGHGRAD